MLFISVHTVWTMYSHIFVQRKCFNQLCEADLKCPSYNEKETVLWDFDAIRPSKLVITCFASSIPLSYPVQSKRQAQTQCAPQMALRRPCSVWASLLQPCWPARQNGTPWLCHCRGSGRSQRRAPGWTDAGWLAWDCRHSKLHCWEFLGWGIDSQTFIQAF